MSNTEKETQLPFQSIEFAEAWNEWIKFRCESRFKKYVPIGLKRTFTALIRDSNNDEQTAILIIEQSIEHNWQGLFKLKNNVTGNTNYTTHKLSKHEAGIAGTLKDLKEQLNTGGIPYM